VLFLLKEVEEAIANLCRSHDGSFRTKFWRKLEVFRIEKII
jgi:hypothetical protein